MVMVMLVKKNAKSAKTITTMVLYGYKSITLKFFKIGLYWNAPSYNHRFENNRFFCFRISICTERKYACAQLIGMIP